MVKRAKHSEAIENYLKAIYVLQAETGEPVSTSALSGRLGVSAPSGTAMVKKLASLGLLRYERYRGAELTAEGERAAVEVVRHHRLLEKFLAERLGMAIDDVHDEAERLEHALSEELEARIDRELGFPTHDPHGDPIPDAELKVSSGALRTLGDLEPGQQATVQRVPDRDRELLRYLSSLGLLPGRVVEVLSTAPFGGPITVLAGGAEAAISRELAAVVAVG